MVALREMNIGIGNTTQFLVLQDPAWRPREGRFHEPDPHVRTLRGESFRFPDRAGTPHDQSDIQPSGLDALELPADGRR